MNCDGVDIWVDVVFDGKNEVLKKVGFYVYVGEVVVGVEKVLVWGEVGFDEFVCCMRINKVIGRFC